MVTALLLTALCTIKEPCSVPFRPGHRAIAFVIMLEQCDGDVLLVKERGFRMWYRCRRGKDKLVWPKGK